MTTTAAAWRHGSEHDGECVGSATCICTTPTPDPASPCGFVMFGEACGGTEDEHGGQTDPPYQPTRCTCGHALEAVRIQDTDVEWPGGL